jgi:(5-formylfuran-3-yl)methyl phosphate synthase
VTDFSIKFFPPKLLVSVRDLKEAQAALEGGCDWLDVKEPAAGSLGAPSAKNLAEIAPISGSFVGWSAALGELRELTESNGNMLIESFPNLTMVKLGLSECANTTGWRDRLKKFKQCQPQVSLATVYYADRANANSPDWDTTVDVALELDSPVILIDTYSKNGQSLLDYLSLEQLQAFRIQLRELGLGFALAGSLQTEHIPQLISKVHPDLVAVRGAACKSGRNSDLCSARVALLKRIINQPGD